MDVVVTSHADSAQILRKLIAEPHVRPMMHLASFGLLAELAEIIAPLQMLVTNTSPLRGADISEISLAWHLADDTGKSSVTTYN